jgi:sarcosine oxidase subunit alpha
VLPAGANIAGELKPKPPMPIAGNVTSTYFSPTLGRSIAMALIKDGRSLIGQKVAIPLADKVVRAEVVRPLFYDPEGKRLHA